MTPDPLAALFAELGRLHGLTRLESELSRRGFSRIAGVDEVGRGCLAGPVVAAAVILPLACVLPGLDDSKRVDAEERGFLDREIRSRAVAFAVGVVEARQIDAGDILRASLEAMRVAVGLLASLPDVLLVDAVRVPGVAMPQLPVIHGD
ncbi:MAG TPA: ribonuclease HII, partial [Thermoanaerobaculia bacterium]